GTEAKETYIHEAMINPDFFLETGGTPALTDSVGSPWTASYVTANGNSTVDLRTTIAAESRAKIVYENLMKFTDDVYVKDSLRFLMTREVAHFQMFQAALDKIQPNFPPGILQSDPRFSNKYFNMSNGEDFKGPWNEGKSPEMKEDWQVIDKPQDHVQDTNGLLDEETKGTQRAEKSVQKDNKALSKERKAEIDKATKPNNGILSWSDYVYSAEAKMNKDKQKK